MIFGNPIIFEKLVKRTVRKNFITKNIIKSIIFSKKSCDTKFFTT